MRVAIANRGEVAVRIIRACQELGHQSILIHSTPDRETLAFRLADEKIEISGFSPLETYLDIQKILDAAKLVRAEMIHPGFGFLSENSDFVSRVEASGIIFVGPKSKTINLAGNKINAKALAMKAGVPVIPAYSGREKNPEKLLKEAEKIGFPCIVKAASGGGGKGMKVVRSRETFIESLESAQREAKSAFGSDEIFIEKYLENPRHIEVQILCDSFGNRIHLFERDCSIQRRHQKIFEETPAEILSPELREKITKSALKLAESCDYLNAGTVEFLLDSKSNFYFMELNTRLQVEHTVTEMVCGIDLVKQQFRIAEGIKLNLTQDQIAQRGHSIEVRIYAEDPENQFLPSTGKILALDLPFGPNRRFDFGYGIGDEVTPFYDPMLGKIITWAETRKECLERMYSTLSETIIFGVSTNIEFLKSVLKNKSFIENKISTSFLEKEFLAGFEAPPLTEGQLAVQQNIIGRKLKTGLAHLAPQNQKDFYQSPWNSKW